MTIASTLGWVAVRVTLGYVYLFALYMNTRNAAARKWTIEHTGYMFRNWPDKSRLFLARLFATTGMIVMGLGGLSVLLGIEGRAGGLLLLVFTLGGVYSHKCEREIATALASKIEPLVPAEAKGDFGTLQWSAFSGHFSSGLKNWALCGICAAFILWGTGPMSLSDHLATLFEW